MMKKLIENFSNQIRESITIAETNPLKNPEREIRNVVISGLGGSGIGGTIVADIAKVASPIPVLVNKEYSAPAFVNEHTLFIASSYSGGTEETLQAVREASLKNAMVVCITSGGKLAEFAQSKNYDTRIIPGGNPPRACFGYSFTQLFSILSEYKILSKTYYAQLAEAADFLDREENSIVEESHKFALQIADKIPVIYSEASIEGVAVRFRQQLNENSKMLCWHHAIPEMNHNELVGWTEENPKLAVIFLRSESDYVRNRARMEINRRIVSQYTPHIHELWAKGTNDVERIVYLIHFCDWISYHLSEIRQVDVMDIKVIDYLKGELSKL